MGTGYQAYNLDRLSRTYTFSSYSVPKYQEYSTEKNTDSLASFSWQAAKHLAYELQIELLPLTSLARKSAHRADSKHFTPSTSILSKDRTHFSFNELIPKNSLLTLNARLTREFLLQIWPQLDLENLSNLGLDTPLLDKCRRMLFQDGLY